MMMIQVTVKIPPDELCSYPPKNGDARGYTCPWMLSHLAARKKWCRIFDDADVSHGLKCTACLEKTHEAALAERKERDGT